MANIEDSSILISVFKNNTKGVLDLVTVQPWLDELPRIEDTIEFVHEDQMYYAEISEVVWRLSTTDKDKNLWMKQRSILINAIVLN